MKIIEKEITIKERIIQMTEKELSDIKNKCYYNGIDDTLDYIKYLFKHYKTNEDIFFITEFFKSVGNFINYRK